MEALLIACEKEDWELGQLLRFYARSGVRKGAAIGSKTKLRWSDIDFANEDIVMTQKGGVRRRVPMGPQLSKDLRIWHAHCQPGSSDELVFPFGSTKEDRMQSILRKNATARRRRCADDSPARVKALFQNPTPEATNAQRRFRFSDLQFRFCSAPIRATCIDTTSTALLASS